MWNGSSCWRNVIMRPGDDTVSTAASRSVQEPLPASWPMSPELQATTNLHAVCTFLLLRDLDLYLILLFFDTVIHLLLYLLSWRRRRYIHPKHGNHLHDYKTLQPDSIRWLKLSWLRFSPGVISRVFSFSPVSDVRVWRQSVSAACTVTAPGECKSTSEARR